MTFLLIIVFLTMSILNFAYAAKRFTTKEFLWFGINISFALLFIAKTIQLLLVM